MIRALLILSPAALLVPSLFAGDQLQQYEIAGAGERMCVLGDVDGDGIDDFAVGVTGGGLAAQVISGLYGYGLFGVQDFGSVGTPPLAPALDVDGDGVPDLAVGFQASATHSGAVFSGVDGALILAIPNPAPGSGNDFGRRVVGVGDLDGDGHGEIVVTSPLEAGLGHGGNVVPESGRARVYSGADGSLVFTIDPQFLGFRFGIDASNLGDVNDDGVPDFLVSSRREVQVISGATGLTIRTWTGDPETGFGTAITDVEDADFDDVKDVAIGMPDTGLFGRVAVYSGRTGQPLNDFAGGFGPGSRFGASLAPLPKAGPDTVSRVLVGAPGSFGPGEPSLGGAFVCEIGGNQSVLAYGAEPGSGLGRAVAGLFTDVNGDGALDGLVSELVTGPSGQPHYVVRMVTLANLGLETDVVNVSLSQGGAQVMRIEGMAIVPNIYGPVEDLAAGRPYVVLGSFTGNQPGVDAGAFHLPLNPDAYFTLTATYPNSLFIAGGAGTLDQEGNAWAAFCVPPVDAPGLAGLVLHHAAIVLSGPGLGGGIRGISNAAPIRFEP